MVKEKAKQDKELFLDALKKLISKSGKTQKQCAKELDTTAQTISNNITTGNMKVERLMQILSFFETSIGDVHSEINQVSDSSELPEDSEGFLRDDPLTLLIAILLGNRWEKAEIANEYALSEIDLSKRLEGLEDMKMIKLKNTGGSNQQIVFMASPNFGWKENGPIDKLIREKVLPEFFSTTFSGDSKFMRYTPMTLSQSSFELAEDILNKAHNDILKLVQTDAKMNVKDRKNCSVVIALKQWVYSEFAQFPRVTHMD